MNTYVGQPRWEKSAHNITFLGTARNFASMHKTWFAYFKHFHIYSLSSHLPWPFPLTYLNWKKSVASQKKFGRVSLYTDSLKLAFRSRVSPISHRRECMHKTWFILGPNKVLANGWNLTCFEPYMGYIVMLYKKGNYCI